MVSNCRFNCGNPAHSIDFAEVQEKIKKQTLVPIDGGLLSPYTEEMVILSVLLFVPEIPARQFL